MKIGLHSRASLLDFKMSPPGCHPILKPHQTLPYMTYIGDISCNTSNSSILNNEYNPLQPHIFSLIKCPGPWVVTPNPNLPGYHPHSQTQPIPPIIVFII